MDRSDKVAYLSKAITLARRALGHTRPNPPVGAVVVKNGKIIGSGCHVRCGADHAEVAALKSCKCSPKGATVYVTLEPCSVPGRVGACCDALIRAGVKKVVWAVSDPNPKNAGRAAKVLNAAGIVTECLEDADNDKSVGRVVDNARSLIRPFAKLVTTGLPYVTVKLAMSLDGRICDVFGGSKWITSAKMRSRVGKFRQCADVVMVGAETIRRDNPSLLSHGKPNDDLYRVIISRSGKLPKKAQVFTDDAADRTLVFDNVGNAMRELGKRGFMHVYCEGGLKLAVALAEAGLVDEWITCMAPIVIGNQKVSKAMTIGKATCVHDSGLQHILP